MNESKATRYKRQIEERLIIEWNSWKLGNGDDMEVSVRGEAAHRKKESDWSSGGVFLHTHTHTDSN